MYKHNLKQSKCLIETIWTHYVTHILGFKQEEINILVGCCTWLNAMSELLYD